MVASTCIGYCGRPRFGCHQLLEVGGVGKERECLEGVGVRLYISTTQDVDQLAARAREHGVTLDAEPHDTEWRSRAFDVTEPTGFKITIAKN